jgi:hypothetical protein
VSVEDGSDMTREEGIQTVYGGPIHVVILGAGASIASTIHNPEPSGKKLPSMDNLIDVVGLRQILDSASSDCHAVFFFLRRVTFFSAGGPGKQWQGSHQS